jgi:O-antigen/teichoic acid export membrane protein
VVLLSVAVAISLFVYDLLRVMATPPFWSAAELVPLILIAYVLQSWASVQDIGILLAERTRYVAVANFVAAGVAVVGYLIFIPRYLQWGAASVTVVAFAVQFGLIYWFSQRLRRVRYRWRPVLLLCGWAAVAVGVSLLLPELPLIRSILARSAIGLIFLTGVWVLPILERRDREALFGLVDPMKRMLLSARSTKR